MHTCFHPDLKEGVNVLPEEEAIHVVRVLRMKDGDALRLVDGRGGTAAGHLTSVSKRSAAVLVEEVQRETARPRGLVLVVAPTKHTDRFEWLLEKATELGVEEIVPVWTERSERRVDKHDRWSKVVVAATKQCQRLWKPELRPSCELRKLFAAFPELMGRDGAVAHCMESVSGAPAKESWKTWQESRDHAWLAIGPEGDFSEGEVQWLVEHGAHPVHLGDLRLRTETAGMAAVAQFG